MDDGGAHAGVFGQLKLGDSTLGAQGLEQSADLRARVGVIHRDQTIELQKKFPYKGEGGGCVPWWFYA